MKLTLTNQPRTLSLPFGVAVEVRPGCTAVIVAAGEEIAQSAEKGRTAFVKAVARQAIIGWTGLEDETGAPLAVGPAAIDALMDHYPVFAAFERLYVNPAFAVVTEGND
jgi:hypothetical protein